jgi:hypothetical protein
MIWCLQDEILPRLKEAFVGPEQRYYHSLTCTNLIADKGSWNPLRYFEESPANSKAHLYQRVNRESYSPRIDMSWAHGSYLGCHMGYVSKSLASPWKYMARYKICTANNVSIGEETRNHSLALLKSHMVGPFKNKYSLRSEINVILSYQHLFLIEVSISYSSNNSHAL